MGGHSGGCPTWDVLTAGNTHPHLCVSVCAAEGRGGGADPRASPTGLSHDAPPSLHAAPQCPAQRPARGDGLLRGTLPLPCCIPTISVCSRVTARLGRGRPVEPLPTPTDPLRAPWSGCRPGVTAGRLRWDGCALSRHVKHRLPQATLLWVMGLDLVAETWPMFRPLWGRETVETPGSPARPGGAPPVRSQSRLSQVQLAALWARVVPAASACGHCCPSPTCLPSPASPGPGALSWLLPRAGGATPGDPQQHTPELESACALRPLACSTLGSVPRRRARALLVGN